MVRLTDCPDMTVDVYRGRKTTTQSDFLGLFCDCETGNAVCSTK